jgi:O-antigen/teichoic acid export membrane protein
VEPRDQRDHRDVADDTGVIVYSRLAAGGIGLVALAVAARSLSRADFAYVAFAIMVFSTALALGSMGLHEAVYYFLGNRPNDAPAVIRQATFLLACASGPAIAVVALLVFVARPDVDLRPVFPWLALSLAIELPTQPALNALIATRHARVASSIFVGLAAVRATAMIVPILLGEPVTAIVPALAIGSTARLIVYIGILARWFPGPARWSDRGQIRTILVFTLPVGFAEMCGALNQQLDKYLVSILLGVSDLAQYAVGAWEFPLITIIPFAVGAAVQSRYVQRWAEHDRAGLLELWRTAVRKTALLVIPLAVMILVLAEDLLVTMFSENYRAAALPFRLFNGILLLRFASYGALFRAVGHTRPLLIQAALLVILNLALGVPFTYAFGFPGPALATLVANWIVWLVTLATLTKVLDCRLRDALPWLAYARTIVTAGAAGAILAWAREAAALGAGANLALGPPVFIALFFALAAPQRLIERGDLAFLRRWLTLRLLRDDSGR